MRLGWLQGELALGPLWPLPHTPRLGSSFRKLVDPSLKAMAWELDASRGAGPAPAVWVRLVGRSVQQWMMNPLSQQGKGGEGWGCVAGEGVP